MKINTIAILASFALSSSAMALPTLNAAVNINSCEKAVAMRVAAVAWHQALDAKELTGMLSHFDIHKYATSSPFCYVTGGIHGLTVTQVNHNGTKAGEVLTLQGTDFLSPSDHAKAMYPDASLSLSDASVLLKWKKLNSSCGVAADIQRGLTVVLRFKKGLKKLARVGCQLKTGTK